MSSVTIRRYDDKIDLTFNLEPEWTEVWKQLNVDIKKPALKHFIKAAEELKFVEFEQFLKGLTKKELVFPADSSLFATLTDEQIRLLFSAAYRDLKAHTSVNTGELNDVEEFKFLIESNLQGLLANQTADDPLALTIVVNGSMYRLDPVALPAPDVYLANLQQQKALYKAQLYSLSQTLETEILHLQEKVDRLFKADDNKVPPWFAERPQSLLGKAAFISNEGNYTTFVFYYFDMKLLRIHKGEVICILKEPISYPPMQLFVTLSGDRYYNSWVVCGPNDTVFPHFKYDRNCVGEAKFPIMRSGRDLAEYYKIFRTIGETFNLNSPYNPTYEPMNKVYNLCFDSNDVFKWPEDLLEPSKSGPTIVNL